MNADSVPAAPRRQILTFRIADEWYALDVACVRRVEAAPDVTAVPSAPDALPGVFVSQGQLIPVVDPRVVLRLPAAAGGAPAFVVIAAHGDLVGGVLVDWVDEVVRVEKGLMEPTTAQGAAAFAAGQIRLGGRLVSVLDPEALFRAAAGDA